MAGPTIVKGEDHFACVTYEGTGTGQKVGKFVPFTNNATISKAVRFNYADTPKLISGALGTPTSDKKFTFSSWFKVGQLTQQYQGIFSTSTDNSGSGGNVSRYSPLFALNQNSAEKNPFGYDYNGSGYVWYYSMNDAIDLEDVSQWHHVVVRIDTTQSTEADRMRVYIDGNQITSFSSTVYPSLNAEIATTKSGYYHDIGLGYNARFEGCLAEVNLLDGQSYGPDTFGITDTSTGNWIPKSFSGLSYGNNGFRAQFANTAGQTLGYVTGGGTANNFFTATNMDSTDCITDTPTSNHMVFDQQITTGSGSTIKQAGTEVNFVSGSGYPTVATSMLIPNSGKWYWEVQCSHTGGVQGISNAPIGVIDTNFAWGGSISTSKPFPQSYGGMGSTFWSGFRFNSVFTNTSTHDIVIGSNVIENNDWIVIAMDMDDGKGYWGWYDTSAGGSVTWFANDGGTDGNPSTGANPTVTFDPRAHSFQVAQGGYAPGSYPGVFAYNFGQRAFNFTAPTGFVGLSQDQFPATAGKSHFGRSGAASFIPDLVWSKNRDQTDDVTFYDSSRGIKNRLRSNSTDGEDVQHDGLQKFLKGGYETLQDTAQNSIDESYVSWMWKAGGGTTSANTDGVGASVACTIQKNTDAGFSIVEWTGGGSAGTIEHGLGAVPQFMFYKRKSADGDGWIVYHHKMNATPEDGSFQLQTAGQFSDDATLWNDTAPTAQLATIGSYGMGNTEKRVGFFWTGVEGYSKFGSYEGNNNNDGTFIYTGFKPALVMVKAVDANQGWVVFDNARYPVNPNEGVVYWHISNVERVGTENMDFLANGFKCRNNDADMNQNTIMYAAWAKHPFVGDGTNPATAV